MAHVTGSVNSASDLLTAIRSACTSNGWTLSGEILHKGNVYVRTQLVESNLGIEFKGGTGKDGSNNLTGACPGASRIHALGTGTPLTYPMTYEVHLNTSPDEVYVVVNYAVDKYQFAAWGQSDVSGLPGTGGWFAATGFAATAGPADDGFVVGGGGGFGQPASFNSGAGGAMFYSGLVTTSISNNSWIHHGLDGGSWNQLTSYQPSTFDYLRPLLEILPNTWNNETVLLPYPVYCPRSSGNKSSLAADLKHIRLCRMNFHDPGDIITLGSDDWKLYPFFRKSTTGTIDFTNGYPTSNTYGFAVRYTGS